MPAKRNDPSLPPLPPEGVRAWRERLGLTQVEAAKALGVSRDHYISYERGTLTGRRADRTVSAPRSLRLAMAAVEAGLPPV